MVTICYNAESVLHIIDEWAETLCFGGGKAMARGLREKISELPAADVQEVKHGYWQNEYRSGTTVKEGVVSSCCDMWNNRKSQFCPNCGARMDGDDE